MSKNPKGLLNDLKFDEIFRKDVTCDNIKSHKKAKLHHLSRRHILEKQQEEIKLTPPAFSGLRQSVLKNIANFKRKQLCWNLSYLK